MATQTKYSPRTYGNRTSNTWKDTICDADGSNCRTETYYVTVQDPGDGGLGGASKNQFTSPKDALQGKTTIYKRNDGILGYLTGQSGDIIVGEIPAYGSKKGKLVPPPNVWSGTPLDNAVSYFSKPENLKRVKNQAILTTKKGMLADKDVYGVDMEPVTDDPIVAQTKSETLLETPTPLPSEDPPPTEKPIPKSKSTFTDSGEDKITRKNYGTFMYPENLGKTTQDYIKIDMMKYDTAGLDITKDRAGLGGIGNNGKERKSIGSVILPIPGGIKDSNKATWGGETLNAVEMAAASLALETIKGGAKGAAGELSKIAKSIKTDDQGLGDFTNATAALFASAAIGKDFKSLMGRTTGQILNPNMELLFQSPSLRPFSFTFLLAPRTKSEAQQVIQIIRFFKQGMAPIRSEAHLFLKAPHTFQLQYKHRGENHPYLNKFKECALQNCEINYTPQNNYSTFEDGVMNAYEMTLSFEELTPIYNDDYEDTTASSLTDGVEWDLVGDYSGLGGRPGDESGPEIGY